MIDLRAELNELFNFDEGGVGRWVMVRHFTDEHSEYWKPETQESVGGPAYKYVDSVVKTYSIYSQVPPRAKGSHIEPFGYSIDELEKFFFEHNVIIEENDEIFELEYVGVNKPTIIVGDVEEDIINGRVKPKERLKVRKIDPFHCDGSRIEYRVAYGDRTVYR